MILKSKLEGSSVEYKIGERIGKVKDVIVNATDATWPIMGLVVSPGFGKGEVIVTVPNVVKLDDEEGNRLTVGPDAVISKMVVDISTMSKMKLDFIDNLQVLSSDGENVGKVYDVSIATGVRPWKAKKLLVHRNRSDVSSRRLRLDIKHIKNISDKGVELDLSKAQVDKL
jgi:sporulation protein YlmC with PRC-barrel domain